VQQDPDMVWDGMFPYDAVASAGVTPHATMSEIRNARGYFARTRSSSKEVIQAWGELQRIDSRLFYDFFFYRLEQPPEAEGLSE
jgi:hypothetical protein